VIVVSWNSWGDLERCLPSVEAELGDVPAELLVVDSASSDGTPEQLTRSYPRWRVIRCTENVGFAAANNIGFEETAAPLVLLLNPDTRLEPGCLRTLVAAFEADPDLGVAGPLKVNADGSLQPSWGHFPSVWQEFLRQTLLGRFIPVAAPQGPRFTRGQHVLLPHDRDREVDWVTCSGLLLRREAVGPLLFREGHYMYREEVDLCRRIRASGWRIRFLSTPRMLHEMGTSINRDRYRAVRLRLRGEALYYQLNGTRFQRWAGGMLLVLGSLARAAAYRAMAVALPARRHQLSTTAEAYRAAAAEVAQALTGRIELR
jgi:GT2 family glycosyltransferase